MNSRIKFVVVVSSTCLVLLLLIGSVLGKSASPDDAYKHIAVYTEVLQRIKSEYVEEPDMKSVTLGALNGLLESIDPFASYLNAEQYRDYLKEKDRKRADVGLILSKRQGYLGVVGVVPNSPAAKAGLGTLDMIESVKGIGTRDMPLAYANMLLQGDAGSTVEISVVRWRRMEPQNVKLVRAMITYPPVAYRMLPDQIGYVSATTMTPGNVKEIAADLGNLQKQGAQKLVLDLRNCSVGEPDQGTALANLFLSSGTMTYLQGQRVARKNFEAEPSKMVSKLPMVVLTNHGTANAAEVAAGALLDNKRAELVGERTYGDASERRVITMDDGGAIILSVAKYYSPSGKAIQDVGVTPNNPMNEPEAQLELDENGEPLPQQPEATPKKSPEDDPLLKKAVEILKK